jgi:hypothetical protein
MIERIPKVIYIKESWLRSKWMTVPREQKYARLSGHTECLSGKPKDSNVSKVTIRKS